MQNGYPTKTGKAHVRAQASCLPEMFPGLCSNQVSRPAVRYFVSNHSGEGTIARLESRIEYR